MEKFIAEKTQSNNEEVYEKETLEVLENSPEIEEIFYPDKKYLEIKEIESEGLMNEFKNYFQSPVIKDKFENHKDRVEWRNKLKIENPKSLELYQRNRVRLNKIAGVLGIAEILKDKLTEDQIEKFEEINKIIQEIKKDYSSIEFEQKKEIADKLQEISFDAYKKLNE